MPDIRLLTNSMRRCFYDCPRKYNLSNVQLYRPVVGSEALRFGSAFHACLEAYWNGAGLCGMIDAVPREIEGVEVDPFTRETLLVLAAAYFSRWSESDAETFEMLGAEKYFEAPLMNPETRAPSRTWKLAGKIDAVAREKATGRVIIVEHKTSGVDIGPDSDYWLKLQMDGQVSGYYVGAASLGLEVQDCLYDVIRKPTIKPGMVPQLDDAGLKIVVDSATGERVYKKDGSPRLSAGDGMELLKREETPAEWSDRLAADVAANPDKYFARTMVARSEDDLVEYLFDMWAVGRTIADSEKAGRFPRNPAACDRYGKCEFFNVCAGCASLHDETLFKQISTPNPELKEA